MTGASGMGMHAFGLLLWLSRQEWTSAAECQAEPLERLRRQGLARTLFQQDGIEAITLTELGWAEVARVQERLRPLGGAVLEREELPPMFDRLHQLAHQLHELARLGLDMRRAQRLYFSKRTSAALGAARQIEQAFDRAVANIQEPGFELAGGGGHGQP